MVRVPGFSRSGIIHWGLRLLLIIGITIPFQVRFTPRPFSGDEPHNMMAVIAFSQDHDLNVYPSYKSQRYKALGFDNLAPQAIPRNNYIPPEHGVVFPLLLAVPYALFGATGIRVCLIIMSMATACLLCLLMDALKRPMWQGTVAALTLVICPTWQLETPLVLTEVPAAFLTTVTLLLCLLESQRPRRFFPLLLGVLVSTFTVSYLKYTAIGLVLAVYAFSIPTVRRSKLFYTAIILMAAGFIALWITAYGFALGGAGGGVADYRISGAFARYWRAWFDRRHGLTLLQPLVVFWLVFLFRGLLFAGHLLYKSSGNLRSAMSAIVAKGPEMTCEYFCFFTVLTYTLLFAFFVGAPGESFPGRQLTAVLPFIVLGICLNVFRRPTSVLLRVAYASTVFFTAYLLVFASSRLERAKGWQAPRTYRHYFPSLWG